MINGKDYIYSNIDEFVEHSGTSVSYELRKDGVKVSEGVAHQFPDGRSIRFYLNRMAEPYLDTLSWNGLFIGNNFSGMTSNPEAGGQFQLIDTDTSTEICSAYVIKGYGSATGVTNQNIDTHADPRQKIFFSHAGSGETLTIGY